MSAISRRNLFRSMFGRRPENSALSVVELPVQAVKETEIPPLALILDRFCLAYQGSFCSVCSERCPVEGAITLERGRPRVNPDFCTGCKICQDVCPAPKNAVFLVARSPRQGMLAREIEPAVS